MAPSVLCWAAEQPVVSGRAGRDGQLGKELCLYFCNRSFGPGEPGALEEMSSGRRRSTLKKSGMKSQIQSTPNSRVLCSLHSSWCGEEKERLLTCCVWEGHVVFHGHIVEVDHILAVLQVLEVNRKDQSSRDSGIMSTEQDGRLRGWVWGTGE